MTFPGSFGIIKILPKRSEREQEEMTMKRSLALMACVLSSAMVLTAVSPVMAADKERPRQPTQKGMPPQKKPRRILIQKALLWKMASTVQNLIQTAICSM